MGLLRLYLLVTPLLRVALAQMSRGQRAPVFLVWVGCLLALRRGDCLLDLMERIIAPSGKVFGISPVARKQELFRDFQTVAADPGLFEFRVDVVSIVVFAVSAQTEQTRHQQL